MQWKRMKDDDPTILHDCKTYKFPGVPGSDTVVADATTLMKILLKLPRKHRETIRVVSAQAFIEVPSPGSVSHAEQVPGNTELVPINTQEDHNEVVIEAESSLQLELQIQMTMQMEHAATIAKQTTRQKEVELDIIRLKIAHNLV